MAMTTEDEVGVIQADLSGDDTFKTPSISVRRNENNDIDEESITPKESTNRPACVPYTAPIWAATPSLSDDLFNFHIEVIKNGTIIDVLRLGELSRGESSFVSVGRFAPCEIQLDHPSVSRYHCVLQYGRIAGQYGWSLYDLASTHGTRLNKQRVKARAYVPLRPGYVIQFANSSRIFAFCGKDEDDNVDEKSAGSSPVAGASSTSASMMTAAKEAGRNDAIEAGDVKFYEKDPLGALDKYFEREGLPMSFQYAKAERRAGEWSCSIELADLPEADALVSGTGVTRKLAQVACALAACRRLYAAGALVVASSWNKRATYAENDYYDSDEDTYLDRTGQIEAQRAKRRRRCEALADGSTGGASRTHDELLRELADTEEKERNTNAEIKRMLGKNSYTDDDGNLVSTSTNFSMRMAISQMRAKQRRFTAECEQLRRLVELTKPRRLDDIFAAGAKSSAQPGADDDTENAKRNGLLVTGEESKRHDVTAEIEPVNDDDDDVMADDETPKRQPEDAAEQFGAKEFFSRQMDDLKGEEDEAEEQLANRTSGERLYKTVAPPPPAAIVAHASSTHVAAVILPKYGLITREEARVKAPTLVKRRVVHQRGDGQFDDETETAMVGQLKKTKTKLSADYSDTKSDDYVTWMPPQGQSGDGTTPLNKKFQSRY